MIKPILQKHSSNSRLYTSLKHIVKASLLFLVILTLSLGAVAQQKPGYSLLWKISGKGLTKPSYLFGTMHVKDKRAFGFSDSVMRSIQKCGSFALEIHPDTMIKALFERLEKRDSSFNLKNLLNPAEYAALTKRLKEKNGISIDSVSASHAESLLMGEGDKPGDKQTFVDAYLYGIARTMNKNIYGLENAVDQVNKIYGSASELKIRLKELLAANDSIQTSYKETMVDVYNTGNLDSILAFITRDHIMNPELIARNKVMLNSIVKQMAVQNIFAAVGVAHLPGDNGLIALLRKEGYTVTAENASFTGVADKYKVDYFKMKWETYTNKEKGYSMETPGATAVTNTNGLKLVLYPDMANDVYYGSYALKKGTAASPVNAREVIKGVLDNYAAKPNYAILSKKEIMQNGIPVTDLSIKFNKEYMRLQLMVINNTLYALYVGNKLENLNQPYVERFFKSFKSFSPEVEKAEDWIDYDNAIGAFKVQLPEQPEPVIKEVADTAGKKVASFLIKMFIATDKVNMGTYIVRYNDYPAGSYLANKYALFDNLEKEFEGKGKLIGKPSVIYVDGFEGREIKLMLSDKYYTEVRLIARGNRIYFLLKENLTEKATKPIKDSFFSSFSFIPYQKPVLFDFEPADQNFKLKLASVPQVKPDTVIDNLSYLKNSVSAFCTNPNSGGVYGIEYARISDYYRIKSMDSLYNKTIKSLVGYTDTLLSVDTLNLNGIKGRKIVMQRKKTLDKHSEVLLIDNKTVYFLSSHVSSDEQGSATEQAFYNSFALKSKETGFDIYSSKAEKIAADLLSTDTLTFQSARGALSYYDFSADELPAIYKALQHTYPDDTLKKGVRNRLIDVLQKVNDDQTVKTLQNVFAEPGTSDMLRSNIMTSMPMIDKKGGYDIYLKMLTSTAPLKLRYYYDLFSPLSDSLQYASANFKSILPLMATDEYRKEILSIARSMVYESEKDKYIELIKNNFASLTQYANTDMDKYLAIKDSVYTSYSAPIYSYLSLMTKIKNQPLTNSFTAKLIKEDPKGSEIEDAAIARITNHLPTSQLVLNRLMDSIESRYSVMKALDKENQQLKIPLKYRTQAEFAKLCFYQYTDDDDDKPIKISLLGTVADKTAICYAFKFKLPNREEDKTYLGIAGPFKAASTKLDFKGIEAYTLWESKNINWQLQAKKLIPGLKKQKAENAALE